MTEFKIGDLVMDNNGNTYKVVNDATPSIPYLLEAVKRVSKKKKKKLPILTTAKMVTLRKRAIKNGSMRLKIRLSLLVRII